MFIDYDIDGLTPEEANQHKWEIRQGIALFWLLALTLASAMVFAFNAYFGRV
jgi:hypothetical protein